MKLRPGLKAPFTTAVKSALDIICWKFHETFSLLRFAIRELSDADVLSSLLYRNNDNGLPLRRLITS